VIISGACAIAGGTTYPEAAAGGTCTGSG